MGVALPRSSTHPQLHPAQRCRNADLVLPHKSELLPLAADQPTPSRASQERENQTLKVYPATFLGLCKFLKNAIFVLLFSVFLIVSCFSYVFPSLLFQPKGHVCCLWQRAHTAVLGLAPVLARRLMVVLRVLLCDQRRSDARRPSDSKSSWGAQW